MIITTKEDEQLKHPMKEIAMDQGDCVVYIERLAHSVPPGTTASWFQLILPF